MSLYSISLLGLYNWDNTLFDTLSIPTELDKDVLISHILSSAGDFEPVYTEPDFMKYEIGMWSKRHRFTFDRWVKALSKEYDPLHNYNRYEFSNDNEKIGENIDRKIESSSENTASLDSSSTYNSRVENKVSAYDSSEYSPKEETTTNDSSTTETSNSSNNTDKSTDNTDRDMNKDYTHSAHMYGNIGVTTTQQMLRDELDISRFNIYEEIVKLFKSELCVCVW